MFDFVLNISLQNYELLKQLKLKIDLSSPYIHELLKIKIFLLGYKVVHRGCFTTLSICYDGALLWI